MVPLLVCMYIFHRFELILPYLFQTDAEFLKGVSNKINAKPTTPQLMFMCSLYFILWS